MANSIGQTILEQLGENKFIAMTGAKQFVNTENGLVFRFPKSNGVNMCIVVLNGRDTYDVDMYNVRGANVQYKESANEIYAENLAQTFEDMTGLYTSL